MEYPNRVSNSRANLRVGIILSALAAASTLLILNQYIQNNPHSEAVPAYNYETTNSDVVAKSNLESSVTDHSIFLDGSAQ